MDHGQKNEARELRAAQSALLASIAAAAETASCTPAPVKDRFEARATYEARLQAHFDSCGYVTFTTSTGSARVINSRAQLERFAAGVRNCRGYRPARKAAIGRDRESHKAMHACAPDSRIVAMGDAELVALEAGLKAEILERMRTYWRDPRASVGMPSDRLRYAQMIDAAQRELVQRGLLDATDHDKVNAEPVHETLPEDDTAPLFTSTASEADDATPVLEARAASAAALLARPRLRWSAAADAWVPVQRASACSDASPPMPASPPSPRVPIAMLEYRRQRCAMVPVLRQVARIRAGLRDIEFTDRQREFLQRILQRAQARRNAGLFPLLAARQRAFRGTGVPVSPRKRTIAGVPAPQQPAHGRWDALAGCWVPVPAAAA